MGRTGDVGLGVGLGVGVGVGGSGVEDDVDGLGFEDELSDGIGRRQDAVEPVEEPAADGGGAATLQTGDEQRRQPVDAGVVARLGAAPRRAVVGRRLAQLQHPRRLGVVVVLVDPGPYTKNSVTTR